MIKLKYQKMINLLLILHLTITTAMKTNLQSDKVHYLQSKARLEN